MFPTYAIALIGLGVWLVYSTISGLLKNIAAAKRSGLPWFIVREFKSFGPSKAQAHQNIAVDIYSIVWILTHKLWLPLLNRLPKAWTQGWLE